MSSSFHGIETGSPFDGQRPSSKEERDEIPPRDSFVGERKKLRINVIVSS